MTTPNPLTLILFFLLSQFALYSADDNEFKPKPNCPPFDCGSLGKVGYPFSNITNPECGLYDVTNCNGFLPVVHFRGGRSYDVKSFFSHNNINTLVLHDQNPEETLGSKDCNFLNNSGLSDYYRVFKLKNRNFTLLKCPKSFSISPPPPDLEKFTTSGSFRTFNSCQDYNLYYLYPQLASLLPSIPSCSEIQLPLSEPPPEVFKDLYTLLDANIILEWFQRPVGSDRDPTKNQNKIAIGVGAGLGSFSLACLALLFFYLRCRKNRHSKSGRKKKHSKNLLSDEDSPSSESSDPNMLGDNPDLKIFNFEMLLIATNYFNESTKLGRGGFGSVYKGELPDGQVVAIKRLSKSSGQGLQEFKNEVVVISKLQHRNLVRLLGCCIAAEEKILIYEYMPNNSLDTYLFVSDPTKRGLLDWRKRFQIIEGISRGILYLHRDSRLKVIHRDLKPSNVLLDEELNPKISDFGMARIFGSNELQANTNRVVGTYGYMSPEYAMEGQFSEKSDVFSFGVLLLEIVSGRRNSSFYNHDQSLSLLKYAWLLWNENKIQSLIDPMVSEEPHCKLEIVRCIHVGLLCVQEFANDRPTMSATLSMLTSEITTLPTPKQPAFTQELPSSHSSSHEHKTFSVNTITLTSVGGR